MKKYIKSAFRRFRCEFAAIYFMKLYFNSELVIYTIVRHVVGRTKYYKMKNYLFIFPASMKNVIIG